MTTTNQSSNPDQTAAATPNEVRSSVQMRYAQIAQSTAVSACCDSRESACCEGSRKLPGDSSSLGYSRDELGTVPHTADMGLGCGNPHLFARLREGETVLDLGCGAGLDCFLAARAVGSQGQVIGVDMTPAMIEKARANAAKTEAANVEFRLGEVEALPVRDTSVDAVISNCVINLSPNKQRVFAEAFRVLKTGGRLAVSDVVCTTELPPAVASDLAAHCGCVAGAATIVEIDAMLRGAGFIDIAIQPVNESREFIRDWLPGIDASAYIQSARIEATKPAAPCCSTTCCA